MKGKNYRTVIVGRSKSGSDSEISSDGNLNIERKIMTQPGQQCKVIMGNKVVSDNSSCNMVRTLEHIIESIIPLFVVLLLKMQM